MHHSPPVRSRSSPDAAQRLVALSVRSLLAILCLSATAALAQQPGPGNRNAAPPAPATAVPEPPPMPPEAPEPPLPEIGLEPEVTIVPRDTEIHEEYRINGRLYMVKVIPARGPPYYLIDEEGNGKFRRSDFEPTIKIPMWVIKRF
jgi:hypothetical protein